MIASTCCIFANIRIDPWLLAHFFPWPKNWDPELLIDPSFLKLYLNLISASKVITRQKRSFLLNRDFMLRKLPKEWCYNREDLWNKFHIHDLSWWRGGTNIELFVTKNAKILQTMCNLTSIITSRNI